MPDPLALTMASGTAAISASLSSEKRGHVSSKAQHAPHDWQSSLS
jgi:hypothetical protein